MDVKESITAEMSNLVSREFALCKKLSHIDRKEKELHLSVLQEMCSVIVREGELLRNYRFLWKDTSVSIAEADNRNPKGSVKSVHRFIFGHETLN
jgi:hypothetical protein